MTRKRESSGSRRRRAARRPPSPLRLSESALISRLRATPANHDTPPDRLQSLIGELFTPAEISAGIDLLILAASLLKRHGYGEAPHG